MNLVFQLYKCKFKLISSITQNKFFVQPIRNVVTGGSTSNYMCCDNTNKEVVQATNTSFVNPVSFYCGTVSQFMINFGTLNSGSYSSSAKTLETFIVYWYI